MNISRFFVVAAFIAAACAGAQSFAAERTGFKPDSIADKMGGLFPSFRSYVVKVEGDALYITSPEWGSLSEGGFFEVTDGSGARLAVARIKKVEDKFAVCAIVQSTGEIRPGKSFARGFKAPVRMLWMWDISASGSAAASSIDEALRDRGMFDLVSPLHSMAAQTHVEDGDLSRALSSSAEIQKAAQALNAEIAGAVSVKDGNVRITVSLPGALVLSEITSGPVAMDAPIIAQESRQEPETDSTESITAEAGREKGTFVFKKWNDAVRHVTETQSKVMDLRERARWKKYTVDNVALSVEPVSGGRLAVVFADSVKLMKPDGDKLSTLWEGRAPSDAKLVSAAAADIDGDGAKEVFVNAAGKEGLRSFVLKIRTDSASIIADGLNYYFSSLKGVSPLAQRGAEGAPFLTGDTFTVIKSGEELSFVPAFSIKKDKDTPVGLVRVDVNGDGAQEAVGINSKGALVVYNQSGETVWKASEFGLTGRNLFSFGGAPIPAPPRILPVMDPSAGLTLAVAGAEYERSGFFGGAKLVRGSVRFVSVKENSCDEEDRLSAPEGWISDLIEGGNGGAIGYIRVLPGTLGDKSEIFLPIE